jgi:4-hydroxybenzoate polyprenyltransferase
MGTERAAGVSAPRPKWRAYLLLSRISNLPTVWSNVLAGVVASRAVLEWPRLPLVAAAVSLMYTAGMFLNDAFDQTFDAAHRPDRPLPAGNVSRREVFVTGFALLAAGELLLAAGASVGAALWGLALAAAIVYYDYRHKRDPLGPVAMGGCRGLVYCVAAAAFSPALPSPVFVAAFAITVYVVALTLVAKQAGPAGRWLVPLLLAGISLVDAAVVALNGGGATLALLAAAGFVLTLVFQRIVPGT